MRTITFRMKPLAVGVLLTTLSLFAGSLRAQEGGQPGEGQEQQAQPTQMNLNDSLREARAENHALETILRSIHSIDTARQNELIQWIITDHAVRSRVISALRKDGYLLSPNSVAEMTVMQSPSQDDQGNLPLLRLVIQSVGIYGEPTMKRVLGSDLYGLVQSRSGYQYTLISTKPSQDNIQFVQIHASLFGGDIIFKSGFGFAINVGDDWDGYPFWLPGTIGTYGLVRNDGTDFQLGIEWPLGQSGIAPFTLSQGLQIRERKLVGAEAFSAGIKQNLNVLPPESGALKFGIEFRDAFTPNVSSFPAFALNPQYQTLPPAGGSGPRYAVDSLYYLGLSAHGYIQYQMPDQVMQGAYIQVGAGMHSIQPVGIGVPPYSGTNPNTDLYFFDKQNYFDPFVKLGYVHTDASGQDFGLSVQYSNELLSDGWVKLFSWLELEAKYATVIGRTPYSWEWKDYVMVSPKLILNF